MFVGSPESKELNQLVDRLAYELSDIRHIITRRANNPAPVDEAFDNLRQALYGFRDAFNEALSDMKPEDDAVSEIEPLRRRRNQRKKRRR